MTRNIKPPGLASFQYDATDFLDAEEIESIIGDDIVFPFQMNAVLHDPQYPYVYTVTGAKGLWFHSFLDGIAEATMVAETKERRLIKEEAIRWVESNEGMFSFAWYCRIFKIERIEEAQKIILTKANPDLYNPLPVVDQTESLMG